MAVWPLARCTRLPFDGNARGVDMCVALPGTVVKIDGEYASVDFSGNMVRAFAGFVPVEVGSRVLVHAGCILQVVSQSQAEETEAILRDMEAMFSPAGGSFSAEDGSAKNDPAYRDFSAGDSSVDGDFSAKSDPAYGDFSTEKGLVDAGIFAVTGGGIG